MTNPQLTKSGFAAIRGAMRSFLGLVAMFGALGLASCVSVEAPDKPIVINLNINIRQEVVYRLNDDAKKLIEEESEIF